jgi:phosphoglycerate dehydrogenase-like enzyme
MTKQLYGGNQVRRVAIPNDWNGAFESAAVVAELRRRIPIDVYGAPPISRSELVDQLGVAEVVVGIRDRTVFDAELLRALPGIRLIVQLGRAGSGQIDRSAAVEQGVLVEFTGSPQGSAHVVEVTLGMMIACARGFVAQDRAVRAGGWPRLRPGVGLEGKTLGIVGLGRVGERVAVAAKALGMRVIAASATLTSERAAAAGVGYRDLETLFSEADVVTLHLRLTEETRGVIGRHLLSRMRVGAILINTARGALVDEGGLVEALASGRICAGLDVYTEEPLPVEHRLRSMDNALLLGHCGWATDASYEFFLPRTVALIEGYLDKVASRQSLLQP